MGGHTPKKTISVKVIWTKQCSALFCRRFIKKNLPSRSNWISPLDQCLPVKILQNVFAEQSWKISCSNWQLRLKSLTNSHVEGPTENSRSGQKVVVKTVHTCHVQHVNVFCQIWVTPPKKTEQFWFNT